MKSKKIITAFILIFISGLVIGAILGFYINSMEFRGHIFGRPSPYFSSPGSMREQLRTRLQNKLDLDENQLNKISPYLKDFAEKMQAFRKNNLNEACHNIDGLFDEIEKILSDEQKKKLAGMRKEMHKHFENKE